MNSVIDLLGFLRSLGISATPKDDEIPFCCPFHQESRPSFAINTEWPHKYNCLACHASGNIYTFVREMTGKSFRDVFGDVAKEVMSIYWRKPPERKETDAWVTPKIHKSGDFHSLNGDVDAWNYLTRTRKVSKKFLDTFGVYATGWAHINGTNVSNRVCFDCVHDGVLQNIECRDRTGQARAKVLYPRGLKREFFYNQDNISLAKDIVVLEGIMDMARVWDIYDNVVSGFGSGFTRNEQQKKILKSWGNRVVIIPDNDDAGISVLETAHSMMDTEFRVAELPINVKDAGDASPQQIEQALADAVWITDWIYRQKQKRKLTW